MIWKAINAAGYQIVWFVSVAGAARGSKFAGPLAAVVFAIMVIALGNKRRADLRLIPLVLLLGERPESFPC